VKTLVKTIVRRGSIFLAVVVVLFLAASAFVLGTETGTRWALRQASQYVPGELLMGESRGTFLRGLEIPRLEYRNDTLHITARHLARGAHEGIRAVGSREELWRRLRRSLARSGL
jgi:autotransporter translocation and assembly factor TamB